MSNLNLFWLKENFASKNSVILDIGCADLHDTINMKQFVPDATFYAFECNPIWLESNIDKSKQHGIHYHHVALSNVEGETQFYPSKSLDGQEWPWSGSILQPGNNLLNERWDWKDTVTVKTINLEKFCNSQNINPSFIHIDVQGAEQKVLSAMGDYRPFAIWAEICEFYMYESETTLNNFNSIMESMGYDQVYIDDYDALYVYKNARLTPYVKLK